MLLKLANQYKKQLIINPIRSVAGSIRVDNSSYQTMSEFTSNFDSKSQFLFLRQEPKDKSALSLKFNNHIHNFDMQPETSLKDLTLRMNQKLNQIRSISFFAPDGVEISK